MRTKILLAAILGVFFGFAFQFATSSRGQVLPTLATPIDQRKPEDVYKLGMESKLGQITFNHLDHVTKNRMPDGKTNIDCVHCHHTAQPLADAMKQTPPHKTVWPADRTTTLTADLFTKDPKAPEVNGCRDCHARAGEKPKLLPEIPQIKPEGATEPLTLTNQQAFHRNCGGCHDEVAKARPDSTAPTSKKCMSCHKKAAA